MNTPSIRQAHEICDSLKADAVLIIALSQDGVKAASYGETRLLCKQAGYTLDYIVDALLDGRIPVWTTAETEKARLDAQAARVIRKAIEEGEYCPTCKVPWDSCDCEPSTIATDYVEDY